MKNSIRFIGPTRRRFQWTVTLLILLIPWFTVDGRSLLRIDIPSLSIYLFGQVLHIEELYLILLASLAILLGFLLITVALGRVWCGWLCPQTTLADVAEWMARHLGLTVHNYRLHGPTSRKIILQGFYMLLAFLVAANLLWYFIPPREFFVRLVKLDLHFAAWITLVLIGMLVYLDLALIRRLVCRDFCPYGRYQTVLIDRATLALHLPDSELERCIECNSCVRACPMEIDIRQGFQVACTNCGRCLDACRKIMAKRGESGLIRYSFGLQGEGPGALLNPRVLLPAAGMVILLIVLAIALFNRPVASLKIAVSHTAAARTLSDGRTGTFFNAWINNRGREKILFHLLAREAETLAPLPLKGQVRGELRPGENRRLDVVLVTPANQSLTVDFILQNQEGMELSTADAYINRIAEE